MDIYESGYGKTIFKENIEKMKAMKPSLAFNSQENFEEQKTKILQKYLELIKIPPKGNNPDVLIEYEDKTNSCYDEIRFSFECEKGIFISAHMLLPKNRNGKLAMVICLQGHSTGVHVSLAREPHPSKEPILVEGDRDFCIQAVKRGYAAVALEQRGFGELSVTDNFRSCHEFYFQLALMGRTLIGERVRDVSSLIDAVEKSFPFIDMSRIGVMGNSGGGTTSYFAACADERIKVSMPSSSFCTFTAAWGSIYHCCCAYVPSILEYMEMPDMAIMIAPRHLIAVNGVHDNLQPFSAAEKAFETVKEIYKASGNAQNCDMVIDPEGHRFYADEAWPVFDRHMRA